MYQPSQYCQNLMEQKTSASNEFHSIYMQVSCPETDSQFPDTDIQGLSSDWDVLLACGKEFKTALHRLLGQIKIESIDEQRFPEFSIERITTMLDALDLSLTDGKKILRDKIEKLEE